MNIKEFRETRGITQTELARVIGCTRQNIGFIEKSHREPTVDIAKKIGAAYDVDWVIFFESECKLKSQASEKVKVNANGG